MKIVLCMWCYKDTESTVQGLCQFCGRFPQPKKRHIFMGSETLRYYERDIKVLIMSDGKQQGMYKSSGINGGMRSRWLPFDGIVFEGHWFNKIRYVQDSKPSLPNHLHRFGTEELLKVSDSLTALDIERGKEVPYLDVNLALGSGFWPVEMAEEAARAFNLRAAS